MKTSKRKTYPIQFEWNARTPPRGYGRRVAARCWNEPFFYGDGAPATEPSVIVRRRDYNALLRKLRELSEDR